MSSGERKAFVDGGVFCLSCVLGLIMTEAFFLCSVATRGKTGGAGAGVCLCSVATCTMAGGRAGGIVDVPPSAAIVSVQHEIFIQWKLLATAIFRYIYVHKNTHREHRKCRRFRYCPRCCC